MRKLLTCTPAPPPPGTFSAFHYIICTCLSDYNSRTIQDIKFKFSAFLNVVEGTKYMKFQSAMCKDFQGDIFGISPIGNYFFTLLSFILGMYCVVFVTL